MSDDAGRVTVRPARREDMARLAGILAGGSIRGAEDPGDLPAYEAAFDEIQATPGSEVLVAEAGGAVVGMCQLVMFRHLQERGGRCAEIESVHVEEARRGQGIGAALVEAAVERAAGAGCYRVQLTSHKSRARAHRFYASLGFTASHEGFKKYLG